MGSKQLNRARFNAAQHPRGDPRNTGRFVARRHDEGDTRLIAPRELTVRSNENQPITLSTNQFGWDAEEVFSRGQCAAFAAALQQELGGTIKVATAQGGGVLVHVWVEESEGFMTDAAQFFEPSTANFLDEMHYQWGTITVEEMTRDQLVEYLHNNSVPNTQDWQAAELMVPAYLDNRRS